MSDTKGNILLATTDWDPEIWLKTFKESASNRKVVTERAENDPSIEYALVWKQKPGSLANLPNLKVIFSLGAGVDHVFRDPQFPDV
ncbi:glyoxylate/hydroxypyruvate reductase A, partial [Brucella melitensis]